ncbi:MAG: sel1 repeat family protein [Alphaproteobacteria bacterium]|nr:MAG: sel1 repeat family protein [Alphaproteobacteria bacterium]
MADSELKDLMAQSREALAEENTNFKTTTGEKILSAAFNVAAGAGAAWAAKAVAASVFATCLPAVGTIALTSVAVGAAVATATWLRKKHLAKKRGLDAPKFWTKDTGKTFLISSAFAGVGGALFAYFTGGFDSCLSTGANDVAVNAAPTPVETAVIAPTAGSDTFVAPIDTSSITAAAEIVPEIVPEVVDETVNTVATETIEQTVVAAPAFSCGDATQSFSNWTAGSETSARVAESFARAGNGSAQGLKDLGYFLFNGFDGVEQNRELAVEFFKCAAEQGNVQAQVDLAYAQYHGLGTAAQPEQALNTMKEIGSKKAEWFVQQWGSKAAAAKL